MGDGKRVHDAAIGGATAEDGRTARRNRNRTAVLDAVIELFAEGVLRPGAAEVAERSGVSERSVFRYFRDSNDLLAAAMARRAEQTEPLLELPGLGAGELADRIDRLVAQRNRLYDATAPTIRAVVAASATLPVLVDAYERRVVQVRTQTRQHFRPELSAMGRTEGRAVATAVDAVTLFAGIELLRVDEGLSAARAADAMRRSLLRLLS